MKPRNYLVKLVHTRSGAGRHANKKTPTRESGKDKRKDMASIKCA